MRRYRVYLRAWWDRRRRESAFGAVMGWLRRRVGRLIIAVAASWLLGTAAIHFAERDVNPDFATWTDSMWQVWVLLFSGLESHPRTPYGRLVTMLLLGAGVGLAGLFTAGVASLFIERMFKRGIMAHLEMENHLVLCNWSSRGLEWIREVHARIIVEKRPVVIIHDQPDEIDLPDLHDDAAFSDVYIVKGDSTSEVALRRARVPKAHSVVILTDEREGKHADGKSILTCIAIRNMCRGDKGPSVAAECRNPAYMNHLKKAGADETISSTELGLRLLARTALFHGMTRVYQELLTVGRDANEMYLLPTPESLVGRDFVEVSGMFMRYRNDKRASMLLGVQRDDQMMLNPFGADVGPLKATDHLILLSRVFLDPTQPLPIVVDPAARKAPNES